MLSVCEHIQKDDVAGDLDASMEEFQEWLQEMDTMLRELQRDLGKLDRDILSKKQLIEANKAQYTRVSIRNAAQCSSFFCCHSLYMLQHVRLARWHDFPQGTSMVGLSGSYTQTVGM